MAHVTLQPCWVQTTSQFRTPYEGSNKRIPAYAKGRTSSSIRKGPVCSTQFNGCPYGQRHLRSSFTMGNPWYLSIQWIREPAAVCFESSVALELRMCSSVVNGHMGLSLLGGTRFGVVLKGNQKESPPFWGPPEKKEDPYDPCHAELRTKSQPLRNKLHKLWRTSTQITC